jgi:hypothetical protein
MAIAYDFPSATYDDGAYTYDGEAIAPEVTPTGGHAKRPVYVGLTREQVDDEDVLMVVM